MKLQTKGKRIKGTICAVSTISSALLRLVEIGASTACFAANHRAQSLLTQSPRRVRLERRPSCRPMLRTLSWGMCNQWHFRLGTVKLRTQLFLWAPMPYVRTNTANFNTNASSLKQKSLRRQRSRGADVRMKDKNELSFPSTPT
jgi:hypothetical protein